jgi:hypothetical protein
MDAIVPWNAALLELFMAMAGQTQNGMKELPSKKVRHSKTDNWDTDTVLDMDTNRENCNSCIPLIAPGKPVAGRSQSHSAP